MCRYISHSMQYAHALIYVSNSVLLGLTNQHLHTCSSRSILPKKLCTTALLELQPHEMEISPTLQETFTTLVSPGGIFQTSADPFFQYPKNLRVICDTFALVLTCFFPSFSAIAGPSVSLAKASGIAEMMTEAAISAIKVPFIIPEQNMCEPCCLENCWS